MTRAEAHHVPADTYQKVMKHFTPKLWLGMTATPDKRDDNVAGKNVYELFNYQIAYEIRLQQAMEENLLCPFHYFGITDLAIIGDDEEAGRDFSMLTSDERVNHIIKQADYYGYSGDKVKGIIFCSNIKETEELSRKFNQMINPSTGKKFRTIALNGSASEPERQTAFERLAMNEEDATADLGPLDYIFSVEILNEGVDIVEVNQVIMLRPTQSPIVFIQQLGRGLRKAEGKEYVVILDFIGNYNNNFMIPIALSGDKTYNKDNIRRYIMEGGRVIPGASTVHFDVISRKRIFASVDNANFSDIKLIKENYTNLKNKLGRIPRLRDFDDYGEMDVIRIFDNNSLGSYYKFLVKYEKDYKVRLSENEEKVIEFVSKKLASGKRIQELQMLKRMLAYAHGLSRLGLFAGLSEDMKGYGKAVSKFQKENIVNVMTNEFPAGVSKKTYSQCVFIEEEGNDYKPTKSFLFRKMVNLLGDNMLKTELEGFETDQEDKISALDPWKNELWVKKWMKAKPMLSEEKLENYFYFMRASAKDNIFTSVEKMSEEAKKIFEGISKHSDLAFNQAKMAVDKISVFDQHQILDGLYQDVISDDSYEKEKVRFFLLWGALNEQLQENTIKYCTDLSAQKISVSQIPYFEGFYAQCKNQGAMKTILERWKSENTMLKTAVEDFL